MTDGLDRVTKALQDRYRIERFLNEIRVTANLQQPREAAFDRRCAQAREPGGQRPLLST
jgi:hypothetical protein